MSPHDAILDQHHGTANRHRDVLPFVIQLKTCRHFIPCLQSSKLAPSRARSGQNHLTLANRRVPLVFKNGSHLHRQGLPAGGPAAHDIQNDLVAKIIGHRGGIEFFGIKDKCIRPS